MRAYTVATVAITLDVPAKWLDNILSHNKVPGVAQSRQGIARRLTTEAVTVLEIALMLGRSFAIPAPRALHIARDLVTQGGVSARYSPESPLALSIDVVAIETDISRRLAEAVELAPHPPRGRPPKR